MAKWSLALFLVSVIRYSYSYSYNLKERKDWWHKVFFSETNTRCLNTSNSNIPRTFQPLWTTPTQVKMQTQASTQGINKFSFSWVHLRSLPTRVNRWKLNHCRPSCKDTSTALAYLSFLVFALDLDNVSYMLSRFVFISQRSTLLHKKNDK